MTEKLNLSKPFFQHIMSPLKSSIFPIFEYYKSIYKHGWTDWVHVTEDEISEKKKNTSSLSPQKGS